MLTYFQQFRKAWRLCARFFTITLIPALKMKSYAERFLTSPDAFNAAVEIIDDLTVAWNAMSGFYLSPTRIHACGITLRVSAGMFGAPTVILRGENVEIIEQISRYLGAASRGYCCVDAVSWHPFDFQL